MSNFTRILGPCSISDAKVYFGIAKELVKLLGLNGDWYFKGSFDKANRTSIYGGRGTGLEKSLEIFKEVKRRYPGILLTTDVHETWQVEKLVGLIDVIQVPAFLSRQTDLVVECARNFDIVNIKKGQWLGPENVIKSVDKVRNINPDGQVWITDRGSNLGYDKLITDTTIVDQLKAAFDKVILDCTHSTQRSREFYTVQGDPVLAARHMLCAPIYNYDGTFAETHPNPRESPSDGDCMINLRLMGALLKKQDDIIDTIMEVRDEKII